MAGIDEPGETGKSETGKGDRPGVSDSDLDRRRLELQASLAARESGKRDRDVRAGGSGAAGYGQAVKLSSEFIAGVAVGAGLGWIIDRAAGTSPFGLIVFLLLGFGAGVLNVMRSAGVVAEAGVKVPKKGSDDPA